MSKEPYSHLYVTCLKRDALRTKSSLQPRHQSYWTIKRRSEMTATGNWTNAFVAMKEFIRSGSCRVFVNSPMVAKFLRFFFLPHSRLVTEKFANFFFWVDEKKKLVEDRGVYKKQIWVGQIGGEPRHVWQKKSWQKEHFFDDGKKGRVSARM